MNAITDYSAMTPFERSKAFGDGMASLYITTRIVAGIESMYRRAWTGTQAKIYVAVAPSQSGKSTAQKIFMKQKAHQIGGIVENVKPGENDFDPVADVSYVTVIDADGKKTHPVVRIEVRQNPTIKALGTHVARALDRRENPPKLGDLAEMTAFYSRHLRNLGVKVMIFDEVQEISRITGSAKNQAVELFKAICKSGYTQLVLAGLEGTLQVVNHDEQISNIATKRHIFGPLSRPNWANPDADLTSDEFISFLRDMRSHLPFDGESPIDARDVAEPMWQYCRGVIGVAKTLLEEATDYAIHRDIDHIDRSVLSATLREELDIEDHYNPFFVEEPEVGP